MTSGFRLLLASALAVVALLVGLAQSHNDIASRMDRDSRDLPEIDAQTAADVDSFAQRIVAAGLYPDAELASTGASEGNEGVAIGDVEAAFIDPALRAFISEDGRWTLLILREDGESRALQLGDTLIDDWQVTSISATSVTFERGDETRTLDAYPSREG